MEVDCEWRFVKACKERLMDFLKELSENFTGGTEKTKDQYPGGQSSTGPVEHEAGMLRTQPLRSLVAL
jgi:hypothetical protein